MPRSDWTNDLDTLLIALYVEIDDHVALPAGSGRAGPSACRMRSRSAWRWPRCCWAPAATSTLRLCYGPLGHLFPYLPKQPGYHKRLKAAAPLLAAVTGHLARQSPVLA